MLYGYTEPLCARTWNHNNIGFFIWKNTQYFHIDSSFFKELCLLSFPYDVYLSSWILDFKDITHFVNCFQSLLNGYNIKISTLRNKCNR